MKKLAYTKFWSDCPIYTPPVLLAILLRLELLTQVLRNIDKVIVFSIRFQTTLKEILSGHKMPILNSPLNIFSYLFHSTCLLYTSDAADDIGQV